MCLQREEILISHVFLKMVTLQMVIFLVVSLSRGTLKEHTQTHSMRFWDPYILIPDLWIVSWAADSTPCPCRYESNPTLGASRLLF